MKHAQAYLKLQEKQRKDLEEFPIAYAFNEEQLQQALEKLGAKKEECVTLWNCGDIMKKVDVPTFKEMMKRHREEIYELLKNEQDAEEAFLYEMDNHEYAINWSGDEDVMACFNLTEQKLREMDLVRVYQRARRKHMEHAREWGVI